MRAKGQWGGGEGEGKGEGTGRDTGSRRAVLAPHVSGGRVLSTWLAWECSPLNDPARRPTIRLQAL
eukprot:781529-Rhodomonas_salina.1